MSRIKKLVLVIAIIVGINIIVVGANILQNGLGGWDGRSVDQILGKPAQEATYNELAALSKSEVMQLFHAASSPQFAQMKGEYRAKLLNVGILSDVSGYYTNHFFGPARWYGKAFFPFEKSRGWGYNIFAEEVGDGNLKLHRTRKMDTWVGKSEIDDKDSFHLVYRAYNDGLVNSMHDEVRQINDTLFICMGYMAAGGGSINPAPFVIHQSPTQWIGLDKES